MSKFQITVKVCYDKKANIAWQLKQNVLWEQYHNQKLPTGWLVVFLNKNKKDFSKENLYAVSRRVHLMMVGGEWYSKDTFCQRSFSKKFIFGDLHKKSTDYFKLFYFNKK